MQGRCLAAHLFPDPSIANPVAIANPVGRSGSREMPDRMRGRHRLDDRRHSDMTASQRLAQLPGHMACMS
jgi:hypothetical protein